MDGEVIKSFLVGLGFGVDATSLTKFNKSIASATLKVTALYTSVKIAAAGILYGISEISEGFEKMGYEYHIIAPAINKALLLRRELLKAYSLAGINIQKVVRDSLKLNLSLTKTKFAFEAIYRSVASRFFETITKQSDIFRSRIYANLPKIQAVLEKFIKFIFKALDATTTLGIRLWSILGRVYTFFVDLDKATDGWSTKVLALIAVWQAFNLSFLATPLGILLTLGVAILTLYDDFKTFQEGGKSFFNWTKFIPIIDSVTVAVKALWKVLEGLFDIVGNIGLAFYELLEEDYSGAWDALKDGAQGVLNVFIALWGAIKGIGGALLSIGGFGANLVAGSPNTGANIQNSPKGVPLASPLGSSNISNAQTNQNVHQQTSINITGAPDANATAKAVGGEMNKQNFDLVRNLKGAVKAGGFQK